jgi:hypothetical protein
MSRAVSNAIHRYLDNVLSDQSSVRLSYDTPSRSVIRGQLLELIEVRIHSYSSNRAHSRTHRVRFPLFTDLRLVDSQ